MENVQSGIFFYISDNIGKKLDTITSDAGYSQIIDKPTHFTNNHPLALTLFLHQILAY